MSENQLIVNVLIEGAIFAFIIVVIAFLLSRFIRDDIGRAFLVIFLFVAAGAYFGFAVLARDLLHTGSIWMLIELLQAIFFGTLALVGWRGSPYWLAAGWGLHPLWDYFLHYLGPGHEFAPVTYAVSCISFDWLVAVYIVIAYRLIGTRRLGFRGIDENESFR